MSFKSPHLRVPIHLVGSPSKNRAPALAIYGRQTIADGDLTVSTTEIQLDDGVDTYTINYVGKSLREVAEEISINAQEFEANPLNEVSYLSTGDLVRYTGDDTLDEGLIIRIEGHVIKYREDVRVRLLLPADTDPRLPWYARIDTGQFIKSHNGIRYFFSVPEYNRQVWSTYFGKPYVDQTNSRVTRVTPKILVCPRTPLFWERGNIKVRINGRLQSGIVEDVDEFNGLIYLTKSIDIADSPTVDYTYREDRYVYRDINLNPSINHMPQFIGQTVLFYLKPSSDSLGRKWGHAVFHSVAPTIEGAVNQIPVGDVPTVLLGALTVRQVNTISEVKLTDTRTRGGGVKHALYDEAVKINRHLLAATDRGTWDVVPYPGNAVLVMSLPATLTGTIDTAEIRKRASRYLAMGVEPVIHFREVTAVGDGFDDDGFDGGFD